MLTYILAVKMLENWYGNSDGNIMLADLHDFICDFAGNVMFLSFVQWCVRSILKFLGQYN